MPRLYHKNAILTGYLDHYCLACEAHLKGEDDIAGHVAKPIHRKALDAAAYVDKFADDCIRKVKKGYYCEFCNVLLSTAAKVGLHVAEPKHCGCKGASLLRREGNAVLAFNGVLIEEKAWHGLIEETCATCNTEFDNELIHKAEPGHILSLVQCKVHFGTGNTVYRKIDDSSFQCLTCNNVLAMSELDSHFNRDEHKQLIHLIEDKTHDATVADDKKIVTANKTDKTTNDNDKKPKTDAVQVTKPAEKPQEKKTEVKPESKNKDKPFELKFHFGDPPKKKSVEPKTEAVETTKKAEPKKELIKESTKTATAKTETGTQIKKPVGPIKLEPGTKDLEEEICKVLDAKDYVAQGENGQKWCLLCDWTMEMSLMVTHIQGRHHQTMLKLHKERIAKKMNDTVVITESVHKDKEVKKIVDIPNLADVKNKADIVDNLSRFANNEIDVNVFTRTVTCKKCSTNIEFSYDAIENHLVEHNKTKIAKKETVKNEENKVNERKMNATPTTVTKTKENETKKVKTPPKTNENEPKKPIISSKKNIKNENEKKPDRSNSVASKDTDEDLEKYAKANELAHSRGGTKVYCRKCDTKIPLSLKNMREHVTGISHKKRAAMIQTQKPTVKTPAKEYIKSFTGVERDVMKDVIINEKFCINFFSFCFFRTANGAIHCLACDVRCGSFAEMATHQELPPHQWAMSEALVVTSMDTEFLREIRGYLHCGYCNTLITAEDLADHLQSCGHREAKTHGRWRLQQYRPEIAQHRRLQEMEAHLMLALLMNGSPYFGN